MEEKYVVYEISEQKVNYNEKPWSFQFLGELHLQDHGFNYGWYTLLAVQLLKNYLLLKNAADFILRSL